MRGMLICIKADLFTVISDGNKYYCKASKLLQKNKQQLKVGDLVEFNVLQEKEAYITKIEKRRNELIRPSVANIDLVVLAISVKEPIFNDNLLDRMLALYEFYDLNVSIVFTKWDLLMNDEIPHMEHIMAYYQGIGYDVHHTTIMNPDLTFLKEAIKNRIVVIAGQSGVGKSSLINLIDPTLNLSTQEISYALGRGKHTTRHTELIDICGGWVADTPGFGTMELTELSEADLAGSFKEIFEASGKCKYNGCLHNAEPGCEVKRLVDNGTILLSRYTNYLQFLNEIKMNRKW